LAIIRDQKLKKAILSMLADEDMTKIIKSTTDIAVSGNEIIKLCDIPHSTVYRKLKWMLENKLLTVDTMKFTDEGKKFSLFKSTIHSINVNMDKSGNMEVSATKNMGIDQFMAKKFLSLDME